MVLNTLESGSSGKVRVVSRTSNSPVPPVKGCVLRSCRPASRSKPIASSRCIVNFHCFSVSKTLPSKRRLGAGLPSMACTRGTSFFRRSPSTGDSRFTRMPGS